TLERGLWNWLDNQYHLCPFLDPAAIRQRGHHAGDSLSQYHRQLRSHVAEWDTEQDGRDLSDDHNHYGKRETRDSGNTDEHDPERPRRYLAPWSVLCAGRDCYGAHCGADRTGEVPDGRFSARIRNGPI